MRLPKADLVATLADRAHSDIDWAVKLWPLVQEHYRRGGVRLPAGSEGGGHVEGTHSDPTSSAALAVFQSGPECEECDEYGNCADHMRSKDVVYDKGPGGQVVKLKPAVLRNEAQQAGSWYYPEHQDRRAMLQLLDALHRLDRAKRALVACVPAQASALAMGNPPTDGRTEADRDCVVCYRVVGQLRGRMCEPCYRAWNRAARPAISGWASKRRGWLKEQETLSSEWDNVRHFSRGPADGVDRRAA